MITRTILKRSYLNIFITYILLHVLFHIGQGVILKHPYHPMTQSMTDMCRWMIAGMIWNMLFINQFIIYKLDLFYKAIIKCEITNNQ
jgi:hypothetical protein